MNAKRQLSVRPLVTTALTLAGLLAMCGLIAHCAGAGRTVYPRPKNQPIEAVLLPLPETLPKNVRVLLRSASSGESLKLTAGEGSVLRVMVLEAGGEARRVDAAEVRLERASSGVDVHADGQAWASGTKEVTIEAVAKGGGSTGGSLLLGANQYEGSIAARRVGSGWSVVNTVQMEQYVRGSLPSEMPASWYEEALKAQAVAIRTYTMFTILAKQRDGQDEDWDVDDTTAYLRYAGVAGEGGSLAKTWRTKAKAAAAATDGELLTWKGQVFKTYFHACSGGRTASVSTAFGEHEIAPLAGSDLDGAGSRCPLYRWEREVSGEKVEAALAALTGQRRTVLSLSPDSGDASGYAWSVTATTAGGSFAVGASQLRSQLGVGKDGMPSTCFEIRRTGGGFEFQGKGWGHGVGLDQWAARDLAEAGSDYRDILRQMYPESAIRKT